MATLIEKMVRHPYFPVYSGSGDHLLLIWYEYNEGHNSIIAKTMPALTHIWKKQFAKEPGASTKEFWRIQIVAPPPVVAERFAEHCYNEECNRFKWHVQSQATEAASIKQLDLPFLKQCHRYVREDGAKPDDFDRRTHYTCVNCEGGYRLIGCTWEELFDLSRNLYQKIEFEKQVKNCGKGFKPTLLEREARDAALRATQLKRKPLPAHDPAQPLYALSNSGGHHNRGIGIVTVDLTEDQGLHHIGFFFQGESVDVPASLRGYVAPTKAEERAKERKDKEHRAARDRKDAEDAVAELTRLFKGVR